MHRGCFLWTPTPPPAGRRTPRPGPVRVCLCSLFLAGSGGPASRARFGAPHFPFGRFVLLLRSAPFGLGWPLLVGVCAFFGLFFFCAPPLFLAFSGFRPWVSWALLLLASPPPLPRLFFVLVFSPSALVRVCFPPPSPFFCFGCCLSGLVFVSCRPLFPLPCPPPLVFYFPFPPRPLLPCFFFVLDFRASCFGWCLFPAVFSAPLPLSFFFFCFCCCLFGLVFVSLRPPFPLPRPPLFFCLLGLLLFPLALLFLFPAPLPLSFVFLCPPPHCVFFLVFGTSCFGWCLFPAAFLFRLPPPLFFADCLVWCLFSRALLFHFPAPLPLSFVFLYPSPPCFFWLSALRALVGVCFLPPSFSAPPPLFFLSWCLFPLALPFLYPAPSPCFLVSSAPSPPPCPGVCVRTGFPSGFFWCRVAEFCAACRAVVSRLAWLWAAVAFSVFCCLVPCC